MSLRIMLFCALDLRQSTGSSNRARLFALGLQVHGAKIGVVASGFPDELSQRDIECHWLQPQQNVADQLVDFGRSFEPDVIYGVTEEKARAVIRASKILGRPCVFDIHAIGAVEAFERWPLNSMRLRRVGESLANLRALREARALTVVSPTLIPVARLLTRECNLIFGPADLERFNPDGERVTLGRQDRIQVLYAGNFMPYQGCSLLLKAAAILIRRGEPYDFTFVGSTKRGDKLIQQWSHLVNTGALRFVDSVDYSEMPRYLRGADILTIPRPRMLSTHFAVPSKLHDYMAAGRAIVATDLAPHRFAVQHGVHGILCRPNPTDLARGLLRLRDSEERQRLGHNARARAAELSSLDRACETLYRVLLRATHA